MTVCHRRTRDISVHTSRADIVVAAMGRPECIGLDHLKPDAVVIDVGVTVVVDAERPRGYRLAGDVNVRALKKSSEMALSPVPGGVVRGSRIDVCQLISLHGCPRGLVGPHDRRHANDGHGGGVGPQS